MSASRFRLFGDSEIERVRARLQSLVDGWAQEWLWKGEAQVRVERELTWPEGAVDWRAAGPGGEFTLALCLPSDWRSAIRPLLTGIAADEGETREIESALGEAVLAALEARLVGEAGNPWLPVPGDSSVDITGPTQGRLSAEILIGGTVLVTAVLGRALVERWTEGASVDAGNVAPLVSLREGLETESVVVEVVVGSAELTLTELQSLSLGDVLRLDRGLKEPLTVLFDGGRQVCGAHLGAVRNRRAVQLAIT